MIKTGYPLISLGLILSAVILLGSCDNTFDPTNRDNGTYSVHGMLNLLEETSYIRVRDMNAPFTLEATEELGAIVTLRNLDSGENTLLSSSVMKHEGVYLHTYHYEENVIPDTRYQLSIENSSGSQVNLDVLTPTLPVPQITRENNACTTPVNMVFEPMNGGTFTIRYGTELDTEEEDGIWGRLIEIGPDNYTDRISLTFIPELRAQGAAFSSAPCSSLLRSGNLYMAIAHYSPGFYERLNEEVTDILETTRRFGGYYADTLAIPVSRF